MSLILCVHRICCEELAKHPPSVGFTFGGIFGEFLQTLTFGLCILIAVSCAKS
jgi:hypothetical protein